MFCLNINRLLSKIDQLRVFRVERKVDIMIVNETKLDI